MTVAALYREPVLLERTLHRHKRLKPLDSLAVAARLNACFVAVSEFPEAAKEYVIGFVPAAAPDAEGRVEVTPALLLGLRDDENLYVQPDGSWDARYLPAFIRRYPLAYMPSAEGQLSLTVDVAWPGFNDSEGERLMQDDGEPTPFLQQKLKFLDAFEEEVQRTRRLCARVVELQLLEPVQVNVTLADGQGFQAGGVQMVSEERIKALPEATAQELLRNGTLGLLYAHLISASNLPRLTERLERRLAGAPATTAPGG